MTPGFLKSLSRATAEQRHFVAVGARGFRIAEPHILIYASLARTGGSNWWRTTTFTKARGGAVE